MWQGLEETDAEIYAVVWETKVLLPATISPTQVNLGDTVHRDNACSCTLLVVKGADVLALAYWLILLSLPMLSPQKLSA